MLRASLISSVVSLSGSSGVQGTFTTRWKTQAALFHSCQSSTLRRKYELTCLSILQGHAPTAASQHSCHCVRGAATTFARAVARRIGAAALVCSALAAALQLVPAAHVGLRYATAVLSYMCARCESAAMTLRTHREGRCLVAALRVSWGTQAVATRQFKKT